jgi:hypothetical protein
LERVEAARMLTNRNGKLTTKLVLNRRKQREQRWLEEASAVLKFSILSVNSCSNFLLEVFYTKKG